MNRLLPRVASILLACAVTLESRAQSVSKPDEPDQVHPVQLRHGLDPKLPLIERVGETPESVLAIFRESGMSPKPFPLTDEDGQKLLAAIEILPPLHRDVLRQRLRRISLLADMPNTALTSTVDSTETFRLFDITIRGAILRQSAGEWLTEKESSCFREDGSTLALRAELGDITAIQYVLLHEATHIVDATRGITPPLQPDPPGNLRETATPFTAGIWEDGRNPAKRYVDEGLMSIRFRQGGKVMDASKMPALYEALGRTPFVSLYASSARTEDLAEYVTAYHLTQKLHQPYRISVFDGKREVIRHEPMNSGISRGRFEWMQQFYE